MSDGNSVKAKTLYDKLWDAHLVRQRDNGNSLIYIDRVLLHEVTSAQAFTGLDESGRKVWRPSASFAVADHQVPTTDRAAGIAGFSDVIARTQVETLTANCRKWGIHEFVLTDKRQGIVHVVGPEQGIILPGMTMVCGDSHTSTHGALATLAQGIGTSELEHVLATQCLLQNKSKNLLVRVDGGLPVGATSKDLALYIIGQLGTAGGTGYAIEYGGEAVRNLSMEARFTLCNMSIEAGARTGLVAYDSTTEDYVAGRPYAPEGDDLSLACAQWRQLRSDDGAQFDKALVINAAYVLPQITWGTKPEQVVAVGGRVPMLSAAHNAVQRDDWRRAMTYMGVSEDQALADLTLDQVFIGSCTNARIEDLRAVAKYVDGKHIAPTLKRAIIVPGSGLVKEQAEHEGLDKIFLSAGFEWREAGCSMCNAMNPDYLGPEERCASTSNRNFEGRQGYRGRTHLVSPVMAAAAAVAGRFVDCR
jgi:3-isopropylmalate/(R)-2-methylmalate dehydratase large subunit